MPYVELQPLVGKGSCGPGLGPGYDLLEKLGPAEFEHGPYDVGAFPAFGDHR